MYIIYIVAMTYIKTNSMDTRHSLLGSWSQ
jgi:hypothetical protein